MDYIIKINNVELEFDWLDLDIFDRYTNAHEVLMDNLKASQKETDLRIMLRNQCEDIFDFFNEVFGEGTDKKIFGNKINWRECFNAFETFVVDFNKMQENDIKNVTTKMNKLVGNRATRRENN